jgi:hypothetical protein
VTVNSSARAVDAARAIMPTHSSQHTFRRNIIESLPHEASAGISDRASGGSAAEIVHQKGFLGKR